MKKPELLTKELCNKGYSGNSSILPHIQFRCRGTGSSPQSIAAYPLPLCTSAEKQNDSEKFAAFSQRRKRNQCTLRHTWLPIRTGDRFVAKRAFVLPTHRLTVDNSDIFYNEI